MATSKRVASKAARELRSKKSSKDEKSVAGAAEAEARPRKAPKLFQKKPKLFTR